MCLSGIGYVVLVFANGVIRERIVQAELGGGGGGGESLATQENIDALNRRIETVYFPLLYSVGGKA